jgi:hypothetical protein
MRRLLMGTLILMLCVAFGAHVASAQTVVNINATASAVTFTSSSVTFHASGTASSSSPTGTYHYTLTGGPVSLTYNGSGDYTPSSTPVLDFTLTGTGGTTGTLTGTVTLVDIQQSGKTGSGQGVGVNTDFETNVTITSATGGMTQFLNNTGVLNLVLHLSSTGAIYEITGSKTASITSGSLTPNPEPASMILFGSGLLALGAAIRRKKGSAISA